MQIRRNTLIRICLVLAAWLFCIYRIYIDFDHGYFFDNLVHTSLMALAGIISLASFFIDYERYKRQKNISSFLSTAVTLVCLAALFVTNDRLKQQDRTPTILYASKFYTGLNTISIDFRENGTYKCEKGSFMGDTYYTRGRYSIKDSLIYLDKANLYDLVTTDKLLMKTIPKNGKAHKINILSLLFGASKPDTLPETFIFQLNNKGDTIPSSLVLRVNIDRLSYRN